MAISKLDREARTILVGLGWRVRTTGELHQVIGHFQEASLAGPGPDLKVDGICGPKTIARLRWCDSRRKKGLPTASAHFSFIEFRCKCGGRFSACPRIWIRRKTIREAEAYRRDLGHGVSVISGCRCVGHNRAVGGATKSQHMFGRAVDFPPERSTEWFAKRQLFDGRGFNPQRLVRHGDTRGAQVSWRYGS
jgi:zinc D-Ala-D-Ala carboxypeptidase